MLISFQVLSCSREDHLLLVDDDLHVTIRDSGIRDEISGQGSIVRQEEADATASTNEVMQYGMGDGLAIKGGSTASKFVHNHQRVRCRFAQDLRQRRQHHIALPGSEHYSP